MHNDERSKRVLKRAKSLLRIGEEEDWHLRNVAAGDILIVAALMELSDEIEGLGDVIGEKS